MPKVKEYDSEIKVRLSSVLKSDFQYYAGDNYSDVLRWLIVDYVRKMKSQGVDDERITDDKK